MPVTKRKDPTGSKGKPGAARGAENPRWPGAPPQRFEDGVCVNVKEWCNSCGEPSTLCYRCSECGADLA